ncbi:MAG: VanZ family protein [Bacteroidia bacterium]
MNPSNLPSIEVNWDIGPDKFVHFSMFAIMTYSLIIGIDLNNWSRRNYWIAGLFSSLYGIIIEFIQGAFLIYRSFDYADMLANAIGAMSVALVLVIGRK